MEVVRAILVTPRAQVLVCQRAPGNFEAGKWCLPGGKADSDNLIKEVRREVAEELGIYVGGLCFLLKVVKSEAIQTYFLGKIDDYQLRNMRSLFNPREICQIACIEATQGKEFAFGDGEIVDYVLRGLV
jgi:8-oxo-dGTP pyrophosphatase MutT (NUDIX family)